MSFRRIMLSFFMVALLAACSGDGKKKEQQEPQPADTLYQKAAKAMEEEDYKNATKFFEEVERQHPYSDLSSRAQLMSAYASYLDQRYEEAIVGLDRYIELHPGAPDVDYAFYLKAMSFYEQISDVRRDQQMTVEALKSLNTLIQRFPASPQHHLTTGQRFAHPAHQSDIRHTRGRAKPDHHPASGVHRLRSRRAQPAPDH